MKFKFIKFKTCDDFFIFLICNGPNRKVWGALSDEGRMRVWYFPQMKKLKPVAGFKLKFVDARSPYQKQRRLAGSGWRTAGFTKAMQAVPADRLSVPKVETSFDE